MTRILLVVLAMLLSCSQVLCEQATVSERAVRVAFGGSAYQVQADGSFTKDTYRSLGH
jgi:hypothetical protein